MSSLDELLQELENKHSPAPVPPAQTDALDQTLVDLQQQYQPRSPTTPPPKGDRLSEMLQTLEQDASHKTLKPSPQNQQICQAIDQLIQTKRQQKKVAAAAKNNIEAIAASEKQKQERKKYWHTKGETWLKNLDPISNEGLWFSEFAGSYESPLDAAIDYLMALE